MTLAPRPLFRDLGIGLFIGAFSGLFGVGGGVLLVPLLVLLFSVEQKRAQATSLVVVALAAVSGAVTYSVGFSVVWEAVPFILVGGLVGTWLGAAVVIRIKTRWLQAAFAVIMIAAAVRLVFMSLGTSAADVPELNVWTIAGYLGSGFAMGLLSSFLGVGGGIVVIPLLVTFFGFSQQLAQGTSLVVMVPIALLGAWRLTKSGFTQWAQGLRIGVGATLGAVGGATLALVIDGQALQLAFAGVVVFAASQMAWKAFKG